MRFSHTVRRCSGVISSFGGAEFSAGGGGRISANGGKGTLAGPGGIEAVSDEALGMMDIVTPEDIAVLLAELREVVFASCSDLSREPVFNAKGSGWLLVRCSSSRGESRCLEEDVPSCEAERRGSGRTSRTVPVGDRWLEVLWRRGGVSS
jgi:hypothetical protein